MNKHKLPIMLFLYFHQNIKIHFRQGIQNNLEILTVFIGIYQSILSDIEKENSVLPKLSVVY